MTTRIDGDLVVSGSLAVGGNAPAPAAGSITNAQLNPAAAIERSKLEQNAFAVYGVDLTQLRVHDNLASLLPAAAADDDLAINSGTFSAADGAPTVQAGDMGGATITRRAAFLFTLPPEYDADESIRIRARARMKTTVADTSATLDVEVYRLDGDGSFEGSPTDLYTGAAQDMNATSWANLDFTLTDTGCAAGDVLMVRLTIAASDSGDAGEMIPELSAIECQLDVRG